MRDGNISGFQFHPESVMSQNGYEILRDELVRILDVEVQKNSEAAQDYVPYNFFTW